MIYIKISYPINEPEKFEIDTNAKQPLVAGLLTEFIRVYTGEVDQSEANELDVYEITLKLDLSDDGWSVKSNTGNKGLTMGIVMDVFQRMPDDGQKMTPQQAALKVGVMLEGRKDSCPTYMMVADSILGDRERCEKALRKLTWNTHADKKKLEEIKSVLLKYHDSLDDNERRITMDTEEITMKKLDHTKVKTGDLMCFTYFVKVKDVQNGSTRLNVCDLDDDSKEISIDGKELIQKSYSADWYDDEIKESKTRIAKILVHSHNCPFTVCFHKADGEERTLRGRLVKPEPLMGRSLVEDLDVDSNHRQRLVDHRTLKWLIVDGTKHIVK